MPPQTVLIIEDDPTMLRVLKDNFESEGYRVRTAGDGEAGREAALASEPDLLVLDIMLPKVNGYELCRGLRQEGLVCPILMLTAKTQEPDVVLGLNLGADDYVGKPFGMQELLARCRALLRRGTKGDRGTCGFGPFVLDLDGHRLLEGDEEITLTPKEFDQLAFCGQRAGQAVSRQQSLRQVWGRGVFVTARTVDRFVNALRKKIEPDLSRPRFIQTVREVGYRFAAEPQIEGR